MTDLKQLRRDSERYYSDSDVRMEYVEALEARVAQLETDLARVKRSRERWKDTACRFQAEVDRETTE